LPEDYRRVLVWRYREERSFEEIGQLLKRSANAAQKLWLRAIERLRQELETPP
jgi:RNA polymerase sigma-70 factor (ECF subfamily)